MTSAIHWLTLICVLVMGQVAPGSEKDSAVNALLRRDATIAYAVRPDGVVRAVYLDSWHGKDAELESLKYIEDCELITAVDSPIGAKGLRHILNVDTLRYLWLGRNHNLGPADYGLLKESGVCELRLLCVPLTKQHMTAISEMPKLEKLTMIQCQWGRGARMVIPRSGSLRTLDIIERHFADEWLSVLREAKQLRQVRIASQNLSAEHLRTLKKARPDMTILIEPWMRNRSE